jgi:hypothetical protein
MSGSQLAALLDDLAARARAAGWSDAAWARRAGVPKETLCRLRSRHSCDLSTLAALARAVGARIGIVDQRSETDEQGLFPRSFDREYEAHLIEALREAAEPPSAARMRELGPPFFVAGLAVLLADEPGFDRGRWLNLAEALHPGMTTVPVYQHWLDRSPLRAARFLPQLRVAGARCGRAGVAA